MPRPDSRGWSQVMADEEAGRSGLVAPDEEAGHPVVVASDKEAGWQGMIAPARGGRSADELAARLEVVAPEYLVVSNTALNRVRVALY